MQENLTNKEKIILVLIGQGYTNKEIVEVFDGLTQYSLRKIKKSFMSKLNAKNPDNAVYLALSKGSIH